jgi:hypothetical protein
MNPRPTELNWSLIPSGENPNYVSFILSSCDCLYFKIYYNYRNVNWKQTRVILRVYKLIQLSAEIATDGEEAAVARGMRSFGWNARTVTATMSGMLNEGGYLTD